MTLSSDSSPNNAMALELDPPSNTSVSTTTTSKTTHTKEKHVMNIKFEFKVDNSASNSFAAPSIHRNILCILERSFPITRLSTLAEPDIIASKMNDDDFQHLFEYEVFERSHHRLVCVAHTITSNASFNEVKNAIQIPLRQHNCFICINNWGTELNIVNVGWIYKANPKIHNRNQIKTIVESTCARLNIKFVNFELFTKGLSFHQPNSDSKRIKTFAIQFACPQCDASAITNLLKSCFDDENTSLPGIFIPSSLSSSQTKAYEKYLQLQNKYLINHRSIRIQGIYPNTLNTVLPLHDNDTLLNIADRCVWTDWLSFTKSTATNGNIIISTTSEAYGTAIQWVDETFLPLHDKIPNKPFPPHYDASKAIRVSPKPRRLAMNDAYTASLIDAISDISDTSYASPPPIHNAWSKPLSIVATPVKDTPDTATNPSAPDSSITHANHSTISQITTLTTMVETLREEMKQQLAAQQQSIEAIVEQTINSKLAALDHRYESIIEQINRRWESAIHQQLAKAERNINTTVDSVIARRDHLHQQQQASNPQQPQSNSDPHASSQPAKVGKQSRPDPGSGSSRARKQPRSISTIVFALA